MAIIQVNFKYGEIKTYGTVLNSTFGVKDRMKIIKRFIEPGSGIQKVYIPNMLLVSKSQNMARREWDI